MLNKTAIIGASGYIGSHILRKYRETYSDCVGTSFSNNTAGLINFDLCADDINKLNLIETGHRSVIIASAMSNVGWCESNPKESYHLNVISTLRIIEQIQDMGMKVYFLSSDYVFDGKEGGYTDKSKTNPCTEYGKQKAEVERELPNITNNYCVFRLSKIYGTTLKDKTLIDDLLTSFINSQKVNVAYDQIFSPTHIEDLVSMIAYCQNNNVTGIVNLCNPKKFSRYAIAAALLHEYAREKDLLNKISLHAIPVMKNRPLDTSLIPSVIIEGMSKWTIKDAIQKLRSDSLAVSCM